MNSPTSLLMCVALWCILLLPHDLSTAVEGSQHQYSGKGINKTTLLWSSHNISMTQPLQDVPDILDVRRVARLRRRLRKRMVSTINPTDYMEVGQIDTQEKSDNVYLT